MRISVILASLIGIVNLTNGQEKKVIWFPQERAFPLLNYDLLETQFYTGAFYFKAEKESYEGAFIPVNIGLQKPFVEWSMLSAKFQIALGAASYTQFEIIKYDANTLRGGLLNNDYKASGYILASKKAHKFRLQLFHISSHLGDDYMLRNEYYELNNKTVNYEQLDATYMFNPKELAYYIGMGVVVSPNTFRDRFMIQLGLQATKSINSTIGLAYGTDVKIYQENSYYPDLHLIIGVNFNRNNKAQINLALDTYYGKIPYSTLKLGNVFWVGPSAKVFL